MAYTIQQIKTALELYDKLKKIVPTVRQLGYPSVHTLYEWINQREATGGKFPDIEPLGVNKRHLKVKMNHEGFSAEHKLKILKRCFEGTECVRDVAIEEGVSRAIIYLWRSKYLREGIFGLQQKKNLRCHKQFCHLRTIKKKNGNEMFIKQLKSFKAGMI